MEVYYSRLQWLGLHAIQRLKCFCLMHIFVIIIIALSAPAWDELAEGGHRSKRIDVWTQRRPDAHGCCNGGTWLPCISTMHVSPPRAAAVLRTATAAGPSRRDFLPHGTRAALSAWRTAPGRLGKSGKKKEIVMLVITLGFHYKAQKQQASMTSWK